MVGQSSSAAMDSVVSRGSFEEVTRGVLPVGSSSEGRNPVGRYCFCCGSPEHLVRACPIDWVQRGQYRVPLERPLRFGPYSQGMPEDQASLFQGLESVLPR